MLALFSGLIWPQGFFLVIFLTLRNWPMGSLLLSTIFLNSLFGVLKTNPTSSKIRCKNISHVRNTWAFNPVKMFRQSWIFEWIIWVCYKYSIFSGIYIISIILKTFLIVFSAFEKASFFSWSQVQHNLEIVTWPRIAFFLKNLKFIEKI